MNRRSFVQVTATAAGLTLGVSLEGCGRRKGAPGQSTFAPDAWIRIESSGLVTVLVDRSEMGQGISTALPMLVAEELDADWAQVRYEFAPADAAYHNPAMGVQATGGSTAVRAGWEPLRRAGATARALLVAAAARSWGVPPDQCGTEPGYVVHRGSDRRAGYGSLATAASHEPVPDHVPLKDPSRFRLIGRPITRLDLVEKVTGSAQFGLDAGPSDAWVAVVIRCPVFGGKVRSADSANALAVPGVKRVVAIRSGLAVVADTFWAAAAGRREMAVEWDYGSAAALDDAAIATELERVSAAGGRLARSVGAPAATASATTLEAVYQVPYLAHATMEPMNCTADVRRDRVTLWVPTQFQDGPVYLAGGGARGVAAGIAGVAVDQVEVHTTHLGGGFGRRSELDVVREAVEISKAVHHPIRLVWTREDDIQHDHYRPATRHEIAAGLASDGSLVSWRQVIASQSIMAKFVPAFVPAWATRLAGPLKGGIDGTAVEGAIDLPYPVANLEIRFAEADLPVPVGYWRSVANSHTAFAIECFIDELADAVGRDPIEYRRSLLAGAPRHRAVLELAAERSGWGTPTPEGHARGVAVHASFGSYVAQVAEVSIVEGRVRVHRVNCAIDCGQVVNPDTVVAQMEGGIVYGLSAALTGRITVHQGRVKESNFHDYPVLRMSEMPAVEVAIVPSRFEPGGVGEPGTPPIAPAVANAVSRLTGRRVRALPIRLG
jgi:isoquinoline 1-oxidoreductase beta subunit